VKTKLKASNTQKKFIAAGNRSIHFPVDVVKEKIVPVALQTTQTPHRNYILQYSVKRCKSRGKFLEAILE